MNAQLDPDARQALREVTGHWADPTRKAFPHVQAAVLIVKTVKSNFQKVEKEVKKLSGFTTPCILEIPISRGNQKYLNWIQKETK